MREFKIPRSRWRRAAFYFSIAAFSTFFINFVFILWATIHKWQTIKDDIGILSNQDCSTIKTLNTGIHVMINVLSTVLLSGSNYCMQCLMAPTRSEIDNAHVKQKWLDIGVPSMRNLWSMPLKKKTIWMLLFASSVPLHLVYNSIIFSSTSVNNYNIISTNAQVAKNHFESTFSGSNWEEVYASFLGEDEVEQLDATRCMEAYGIAFQSSRGNLLLISDDKRSESRTRAIFEKVKDEPSQPLELSQPLSWMCEQSVTVRSGNGTCEDFLLELRRTSRDWTPLGSIVKECYSQLTDEHCKILFSIGLCWAVTVLNLFKAILMLFVAFGSDDESPILTIGDAVASFLENPDESTSDMCLKSKDHFVAGHWYKGPLRFDLTPRRKSAAVTPGQWGVCFLIYFGFIVLSAFLFLGGSRKLSSGGDIMKFGLGAIHTETIVSNGYLGQGSLLDYILLVNTPQLFLSLTYFTYNAQLTSISLITEWDRFSDNKQPKGLRVSSASRGIQRSTYFLQLPYRYSIPLVFFSGILHWLISQSFFLVNLEVYTPSSMRNMSMVPLVDEKSEYPQGTSGISSVTACGWSPLAVLCVIVVIVLMLSFLIIAERQRLRFGMIPVAGSCSAAISAACHPDSEVGKIWEKGLRWGVVDSSGIGHCSFSSETVTFPVRGQMYT